MSEPRIHLQNHGRANRCWICVCILSVKICLLGKDSYFLIGNPQEFPASNISIESSCQSTKPYELLYSLLSHFPVAAKIRLSFRGITSPFKDSCNSETHLKDLHGRRLPSHPLKRKPLMLARWVKQLTKVAFRDLMVEGSW